MNIEYDFFYWGPFLWKSKLPSNLCNELLKKGEFTIQEDHSRICSIVSDVRKFTNKNDLIWIANQLSPYFNAYLNAHSNYHNLSQLVSQIELTDLWVNYQKQYEIIPEHTHDDDLSFVIYLQMPEILITENKNYKGKSAGPGGIKFRYGETTNFAISIHHFLPEVGDIFIFPSKLAHEVFPFHSHCTRISMAGNLKIVQK